MQESNEVLKETFKDKGVKYIAQTLKVSTSLVYKWTHDKDSETSPGADNPLDRLQSIIDCTDNHAPIEWLCQRNGGFFVKNPNKPSELDSSTVLTATQKLLSEFSELLAAVSQSYQNDNAIDRREAAQIREEWEDLKASAERFVLACEKGAFSSAD